MISALLRYVALALAGSTFAVLAYLYAAAGHPVAVALCLILTGACWEACSYVRRAAEQLQDLHHQARRRARAEMRSGVEPWASWCCAAGFVTRGRDHDSTVCAREQP
ncbi:hypothetical protein ACIRJR_09485 [Streptomyces sp. NPDC102402]|uniref:hypothetical protein n=1 Tax=Streptomyces sp. NPDC102402 TaxID=3366169 RepID=UPI003815256F